MSNNPPHQAPVLQFLGIDPQKAQKYAGWLKFEAILFIILGALAIILPGVFSLGLSLFIGWLFLVGGIFGTIGALQTLRAKGGLWRLASGILTAIAGILIITRPLEGVLILTMLIAIYYGVDGLFKIIYGLQASGTPGAGITILNGVFGLIIAWIVYSSWPYSAEWFLGLIIGINMLIGGITLLRLLSAVKNAHH